MDPFLQGVAGKIAVMVFLHNDSAGCDTGPNTQDSRRKRYTEGQGPGIGHIRDKLPGRANREGQLQEGDCTRQDCESQQLKEQGTGYNLP